MLQPLAAAPPAVLKRIALLATDVDDTMTSKGALLPATLAMLHRLHRSGVRVLPVTGRAAGEVQGLARYLPHVSAAIAENGAVLVTPDAELEYLQSRPDPVRLRQAAEMLAQPGDVWRLTPDHFCRVGDMAFERDGRADLALLALREPALALGVHLIWSSVHIHLSLHLPDKGVAVAQIAQRWGYAADEIATIGDSPNDIGLWIGGRFGLTVGTAPVRGKVDVLPHLPEFLTTADAGEGWLELAEKIAVARES